jgi:cell division topological specificity factor
VILDFLSKFEFLTKLFHREDTRQIAKDRLRLVLVHDRSSVAPEVLEGLKEDLIKVIDRYMEIDVQHMELGFERKDGSIAFAASIPIIRVRRTPLVESALISVVTAELPKAEVQEAAPAVEEKPEEKLPATAKVLKKSGKRKRSYPRKRKSSVRRKSVSKPVEEV